MFHKVLIAVNIGMYMQDIMYFDCIAVRFLYPQKDQHHVSLMTSFYLKFVTATF